MQRVLLVAVACGACGPGARPTGPDSAKRTRHQAEAVDAPRADELSGVVVTESGSPVAGAEVLVCAGRAACTFVRQDALPSARSLRELVAARPSWIAESTALATTDDAGRWQVSLRGREPGEAIVVLATSPGRELAYVGSSASGAAENLARIELRRAIPIELALDCEATPCTDIMTTIEPEDRFPDAIRFERLPAGSYHFSVISGFGQPGERRGEGRADTAQASSALEVAVPMAPVGTGHSIRGTAVVRKMDETVTDLTIAATCGGDARIDRRARTDASGSFELKDVGPPPCRLEIVTDFGEQYDNRPGAYYEVVDRLPATDVRLETEVYLRPEHCPPRD